MNDTDVARMRQLRYAALKARALAAAMRSYAAPSDTVFSAGAVSCWQIARIVTGRLRGHPYLSYQRDASPLRAAYFQVGARLTAAASGQRGKRLQAFSNEMKRVARELDNARALTWSVDLSDTLGRLLAQIRRLIKEADAGARREAGALVETDHRGVGDADAIGNNADDLAANWPYLAF
jgi:hypothetical protein